ncbi:hypothetical protein JIN84_13765 [Luteolibacter yonseiensis]|uniref:Chalcone isomerase domain-containing protein n=1 Tax=Luteolibacter yonseiensis TaxID=1144680 RepID=A0A934R654_9BACT|nr:hypothetical protein [Luteolibacter yonseiensis]MBK1816688.1 hypothetical protein [Luteolibacter yonseiensis]
MMRREWIRTGVMLAALAFSGLSTAQDDPGKTNMGRVSVTVYYATNGDPKAAGEGKKEVSKETEKRLRGEERLSFKNYRVLGQDVQPLLRSYESWAQPLKPSDEVLVRFEARSKPTPDEVALDLEFWLSRKKILKTDARLEGGKPLFVLGPEWRGGRLIIAVALASKEKPAS